MLLSAFVNFDFLQEYIYQDAFHLGIAIARTVTSRFCPVSETESLLNEWDKYQPDIPLMVVNPGSCFQYDYDLYQKNIVKTKPKPPTHLQAFYLSIAGLMRDHFLHPALNPIQPANLLSDTLRGSQFVSINSTIIRLSARENESLTEQLYPKVAEAINQTFEPETSISPFTSGDRSLVVARFPQPGWRDRWQQPDNLAKVLTALKRADLSGLDPTTNYSFGYSGLANQYPAMLLKMIESKLISGPTISELWEEAQRGEERPAVGVTSIQIPNHTYFTLTRFSPGTL